MMIINDIVKSATSDGGNNFIYIDVPGHDNHVVEEHLAIEILESRLEYWRVLFADFAEIAAPPPLELPEGSCLV
jgi:hypothetical protein